ncbi:MAG: hypothetical protein ACXVRH_12890 [Thermoleophilaceae bacterium]
MSARRRAAGLRFTLALALALIASGVGAVSGAAFGGGAARGGGVAPGGGAVQPTSLAAARLEGTFSLAGTVTVARDIPGERAGRHYLRTWRFTAPCRSGSCSSARLVRDRGKGRDRLTLRRRGSDYYVGSGRFYAPARCGRRTYARGILVPFTIAVRVTSVGPNAAGVLVARHLRAQYRNTSRTNLTPCVSALGHDAASYHGHQVSDP